MEKRIELEKRGLKPEKVTDLNLDNARSTTIVGLSSDLINLRRLSLNSVGLTSLKGFPKLPKLERLELSDNRISGGLQAFLEAPMLTHLNLSNNRIEDLETVKPLAELKHLRVLDLFNCGVTSVEGYRDKMFAMLPNLKYLDGYDIRENEASSDEGEEDDDDDEADEEEEVGDEDEEDEPEGADEEDEEEDVGLEYLEKEDIDEDDEADYEPGDKEGSSAAAADDDDDEEGSSDQPAKKKKKSE